MKHISCLSKTPPRRAAVWQDVVCQVAHALALIIQLMGGNEPIVTYIDQKCDLPDPNEETS